MSKKTTSHAFQQSAAQPPGPAPKRVKVTLACIVCRKKKVKCDGVQPSCSRCNSMGLACEYSDPPRKRGPPKGYIEVIENRAHRIESLLVWHPQLKMQQQPTADKASALLQPPAAAVTARRCPSTTNALLTVLSTAVQETQSPPGSHDRPSDFVMDELECAESFFSHFNLFFPILSRQHFLHQLQHRPQEMDPLLRYAVLALGCRYATQSHEVSAHFFKRSQQVLNASRDSITTLQAVVIMCWYAYLAGDMQTCRQLRHKQAALVLDLGLHRDPDPSLGIVTMELRRRAFWVAYVTNQWLACCTGEPLMHRELHWDCRWPQLEDSQLQAIDNKKLPQESVPVAYALQITVFAEMIKLTNIIDDHFYNSHDANALTAWFLNLPSYLEYSQPDNGPPSPLTRVYHMLYYTAQIMLHRHSDILGVCNTAANTIIHIAEQMLQHDQYSYLANTYLLSVSLATSIHLDNHSAHIGKSIRVFKDGNSTMLSSLAFESMIDNYLANDRHISLDDEHQFVTKKRKRDKTSDELDLNDLLGLLDWPSQEWFDPNAVIAMPTDTSSSSGSPTHSCFSPSPTLPCDPLQKIDADFLAPFLDLPLDAYTWPDFIPGANQDLIG